MINMIMSNIKAIAALYTTVFIGITARIVAKLKVAENAKNANFTQLPSIATAAANPPTQAIITKIIGVIKKRLSSIVFQKLTEDAVATDLLLIDKFT